MTDELQRDYVRRCLHVLSAAFCLSMGSWEILPRKSKIKTADEDLVLFYFTWLFDQSFIAELERMIHITNSLFLT